MVRTSDAVAIGDLSVASLLRGRKGRFNRRMKLCRLANLRDVLKSKCGKLGAGVRVVNEGGTTGTCPWCLTYAKHGGEVSELC